ncbi:MAG: hypothetical protein JWM40_402 [Frankiales bacterium]|nr:hypothetical protein [Frankiales bacterium]
MVTFRRASPYLLAGLLAAAGTTHFAAPRFYDGIVPHALPGPARAWTYVSGVAELGVAVAVAVPRTRSRGALAAALLFIAVFPANIQMAVDADSSKDRAISYARLPLQVPLVIWAWRVARATSARSTAARSTGARTAAGR